jgi:hypothetical protein
VQILFFISCCVLPIPPLQLANIYVTVTAGSIFKAVEAILRKPDTVLGLLGGALPLVAVYFTNLIIVKVHTHAHTYISLIYGSHNDNKYVLLLTERSHSTQLHTSAQELCWPYAMQYTVQLLVVASVITL